MKKATLIFIVISIFCIDNTMVYAQDQDIVSNEVYIGVGVSKVSMQGLYEFADDFAGVFTSIFGASLTNSSTTSTGIFGLGYNRFISNKIKLGVSANFTRFTHGQEFKFAWGGTQYQKWEDDFMTILVRGDFHYKRTEMITMYSGIALGVCFVHTNNITNAEGLHPENQTFFAYQINAFGIRVGKTFGFFAEAGFGYNGIIQAGLNVRF